MLLVYCIQHQINLTLSYFILRVCEILVYGEEGLVPDFVSSFIHTYICAHKAFLQRWNYSFDKNVRISIKISLKFVSKGPINNIPALVQTMIWRLSGDKPLSEPMMVRSPTHIVVPRPQWVNTIKTHRTFFLWNQAISFIPIYEQWSDGKCFELRHTSYQFSMYSMQFTAV